MSISVRVVKDRSAEALKLTKRQTERLVGEIAGAVETGAKQNLDEMIYSTPEPENYKRTTNLLQSTQQARLSPTEYAVLSGAEYALYVHEGTVNMDPRPYLAEALAAERPKLAARARRIRGTA